MNIINPQPGNVNRPNQIPSLAVMPRIIGAALILLAAHPGAAQTVRQVFAFSSSHSSPTPGAVTPVQGRNGDLYGTTSGLGDVTTDGTVFRATAAGMESALFSFDGTNGEFPLAGLTLATDGSFYGTAGGGAPGYGLLFRVAPGGNYTVLYQFTGQTDGAYPIAPPTEGFDGNLYGTTGPGAGNGGTIYRYAPTRLPQHHLPL